MSGLRTAGVIGASVAVAGGLAFVIWKYASVSGEKEPDAEKKTESCREEKEGTDEGKTEEDVAEEAAVVSASEPVVAAEPQKVPEEKTTRTGESHGTQVLVLGLDGAGKSSLLHHFSFSSTEQEVKPTQGLHAISINRGDLNIEFLEIGGKEELRLYWQKYISKALLLVFVVDSSDPQRFPLAKTHLHELLTSDPNLPLMVLANKQDLPGACSITDLHDALSLSDVGDRKLFIIGTHVNKNRVEPSPGVEDAREMIIQVVCEGR